MAAAWRNTLDKSKQIFLGVGGVEAPWWNTPDYSKQKFFYVVGGRGGTLKIYPIQVEAKSGQTRTYTTIVNPAEQLETVEWNFWRKGLNMDEEEA